MKPPEKICMWFTNTKSIRLHTGLGHIFLSLKVIVASGFTGQPHVREYRSIARGILDVTDVHTSMAVDIAIRTITSRQPRVYASPAQPVLK
mmetsp:Transcript_118689/g.221855  ORF Transcript_118689/g.221855 Transcript_118689/m.221855 type:complete len:91 (+) Transcript_118689:222-494(+)